MLNPDGLYFAYLRKSREDTEVEKYHPGETLKRHEQILNDLAKNMNLPISKCYKEIVSAETVSARPEMQKLLSDIETLKPDGIFVVEIERLARGDTKDQGLILETLKYNNTCVITPAKTYHPSNEFDEEYFEFGLFMSRREYKTINRRLQAGRMASVKEGKWPSNKAPYGYERVKLEKEKGFTLRIIPEQANVVKLIFEMYAWGNAYTNYIPAGTSCICHILNDMQIPPASCAKWEPSAVRAMLINHTYSGKVQWGKRKQIKEMKQGSLTVSRPINPDFLLAQGIHPPIIEAELFESVQKRLSSQSMSPKKGSIKSSLSGLLFCGYCHKPLYRRPKGPHNKEDTLYCRTRGCSCIGSYYSLVEERILYAITTHLREYEDAIINLWNHAQEQTQANSQALMKKQKKQLDQLQLQLKNVYHYFECEFYTYEDFEKRKIILEEKIRQLPKESPSAPLPSIPFSSNWFLKRYESITDPQIKNAMIKHVLHHISYTKDQRGNRYGDYLDCFTLNLFFKF